MRLTESIIKNLNEDENSRPAVNIDYIIGHYEYQPDIEPEEIFKNSNDSSYFTVVKTEQEAKEFNYHSDYWGSADEYQDENVELVSSLEDDIRDGNLLYFMEDDGTKYYFTVTGVAIDRQYNSISHTKILIKEEKSEDDNKEKTVKEAIEQKYEKSNEDYNSFLRDVKHYTGSYDYIYGGKVETECNGYPIKVNYFYYNRPYVGGGYNLVVNVLTPMGVDGEYIQEAIDDAFERNSQSMLSQKEIKDKILQTVESLN